MIVIRAAQMAAFSAAARQGFEDRMATHIQRHFADQYRRLGEEGTRLAIRHGIERAASYGIEAERDVARYIDVMFFLGSDFDRDPALPWAATILNDTNRGPDERMRVLIEASDAAAGKGSSAGVARRGP